MMLKSMLFFCHSAYEMQESALKLQLSYYYTKLSAKEKQCTCTGFVNGQLKIVILTSTLGTGTDIPGIHNIWHQLSAHNLLDEAQQDGCAGRDGHPTITQTYYVAGECHLVLLPDTFNVVALNESLDEWDICHCMWSSQYLNGCAITCLMLSGC